MSAEGVKRALIVASWLLVALPTEAAAPARPYHSVLIPDLATTVHTHVCVTGVVARVTQEPDGDLHIRVENRAKQFVVVEWIPSTHVVTEQERIGNPTAQSPPPPKVGQWGVFCGISREDKKHHWFEVHPLEHWRRVR